MAKDMSPYERVKAAVDHEEADRVPVFPSTVAHAAKIYGVTYKQFCTSAELLAKASINTARVYGFDGIFVQADGWTEAEALGVELVYPEDNAPSGREPIVQSKCDLKKLKIPDPLKDGRMPMVIHANEMIVKETGNEFFIKSQIDQSPFALTCEIRGFQRAFLDTYDDPKFLHQLLEFCTQVQIEYGRAVAATGVHSVFLGEAIGSQISPEQYREFLLPYNSEVIREMKKEEVYVTLHTCGNSTHNFELMAETGADIIEFDNGVDIAWAKRIVGEKTCLQGNINTTSLLSESPEVVEQLAKDCIMKAARGGGYLLSPGCEPGPNTPPDNMKAMVTAAKKYGNYPISDEQQ
jgi:MtaA/CmuA family methyltransferase